METNRIKSEVKMGLSNINLKQQSKNWERKVTNINEKAQLSETGILKHFLGMLRMERKHRNNM